MKTTEVSQMYFSDIAGNEITRLGGGEGFAYDFATCLRFIGIYVANGTGITGYISALSDAVANNIINNE